jgi:hypothetical protein
MFNAHDIQEFKLVWIAGTMGKKLGKKQVSAIDISTTVDRIISREYQLRTNSQLMLGVTKIYKLKADYLYSDAQHALLQFKRFFSMSHDRSVHVQQARQEAITIQENEMLNDLDPEGVFKVPLPFGFSLDTSLSSFDDLIRSTSFQSFSSPSGSSPSFQALQDFAGTPIGSSVVKMYHTPGLSSIPRSSPGMLDSILSKTSLSQKSILLQEVSPHQFLIEAMQSSSEHERMDVLSQHDMDLFDDLRDDFQIAPSQDFDIPHDVSFAQPPSVPDFEMQFQSLTSQQPPGTPIAQHGGLITPKTRQNRKEKKSVFDGVIYLTDHDMHEMRRITDEEAIRAPYQKYQEVSSFHVEAKMYREIDWKESSDTFPVLHLSCLQRLV